MTFTPGIPTANMSLGTSRTKVVGNFTSLFNTISTNHYEPNTTNDGKHIYVQMPALATGFPTNPAGQLSLYVKDVAGRSTVFYKKDNSSNQWQLTGPDPQFGKPGYTYLPGGLFMQWSEVSVPSPGADSTVTFPVPFDNDFGATISLTAVKDSGNTSSSNAYVISASVTPSGFKFSITASTIISVFYIAIGPKA